MWKRKQKREKRNEKIKAGREWKESQYVSQWNGKKKNKKTNYEKKSFAFMLAHCSQLINFMQEKIMPMAKRVKEKKQR